MGFSCSVPPGFTTTPSSSTDNGVPRFDGTTGKVLQTSGVTINDNDIVQAKRFLSVNAAGATAFQMAIADGTTRFIFISTNAETGSGNVGFDFNIYRYSDAGAFIGIPLTITRSNGRTTLESLNALQFGLGKVPIGIQSTIADPSAGATIDSQARTAINSIIDVLQAFGFIS